MIYKQWKEKFPLYERFITNEVLIKEHAFFGRTLPENFVLPNSIQTIEAHAFEGTRLPEGFILYDSIQTIGENAFTWALLPPNCKWSKLDDGNNPIAGSKIIKE